MEDVGKKEILRSNKSKVILQKRLDNEVWESTRKPLLSIKSVEYPLMNKTLISGLILRISSHTFRHANFCHSDFRYTFAVISV